MATDKQIKFCDEYVKDYNGTQAAVRAGYSEKTAAAQASRLLKNPDILAKIKENQKMLVESSCLSEEKIITNLQEVYERCMAAVPVMEWDYNEHELVPTGNFQFDSKGALNALKMLGMHLGMFKQKIDCQPDKNDGFMQALNVKAAEVKWEE